MLNEQSFLRNIPVCIERQEQIVLQSIACSVDSICMRYDDIRSALAKYDQTTIFKIGHRERLEISNLAWSIIDHTHLLCKLIGPKAAPVGYANSFVTKYSCATIMRNAMDHIFQNIRNLSEKQGAIFPVWGVFSYSILKMESGKEPTGFWRIVFSGGPFTHDEHSFLTFENKSRFIEIPAGDFEFAAFDQIINISELRLDVDQLAQKSFGDSLRKRVRESLVQACEGGTLNADELMQQPSGSAIVAVEISFGTADI